MSRPFNVVMLERSKLPQEVVVRNVMARLTKWAMVSSDKKVSLDEVAWLGALFRTALEDARARAGLEPLSGVKQTPTGVIHNVVLSDEIKPRDAI